MGANRPIPTASSGDRTSVHRGSAPVPTAAGPGRGAGAAVQVPLGRAGRTRVGGSRALTQVSLFLLGALGFFLFSFKPVLVGGEGEISFQFPPPLLQSRAALGEREALKHSGQADFSGSSPPPPTPAPPPHDWGVGMEGGVGAHPTGRGSRWRDAEEQEEVAREGRRKGLRGRLRAAVPSRESRLPAGAFLSAGLPAEGSAEPGAAPPHAVPGGSPGRRRAAGQCRGLGAARTRCGGRGRAEEQRQVPAGRPELFMGGVLYSLAQIGAAVQCYPRALRSLAPSSSSSSPVLARSEPLQRLGSHFLCHLASSRGVLLRKQK